MEMKRKLHSSRGFTLAETLLAVMILLLVSAIVAAGIPAAKSAYEKVVLASNAEVQLSTTISTLRNELGTALNVELSDDGQEITYYNPRRGSASRIYKEGGTMAVQLNYSSDTMVDAFRPDTEDGLIFQRMPKGEMYVTYKDVTVTNGIVQFKDLVVKRGSTELTKPRNLSIRVMSVEQ